MQEGSLKDALATLGITITPPAPSERMVKLAREIAREAVDGGDLYVRVALAALQHAEKVVRDAPTYKTMNGQMLIDSAHILNQIGAE